MHEQKTVFVGRDLDVYTWTKDGAMENTCKMRGQGNGVKLGTSQVSQKKKFGVIRTTSILLNPKGVKRIFPRMYEH